MIRQMMRTGGLAAVLVSACFAQDRRVRVEGGGGDLINDVDKSTVVLHPATDYIEGSTAILADIDLGKVDVEATSIWLNEVYGGPKENPTAAMVRGFVDSLKGAGVSHLFVTAATRSIIDGGPIVIIPCENSAIVNGLATVILQNAPQDPAQKVFVRDHVVLAGAATAIDRVTVGDGVERADLILPLRHDELLDHTLVIALPEESRRDLAELWPDRLPRESPIQFSPRAMAEDVQRIVISLRLPPDPMMLIRVETPNAIAVDRLRKVVEEMIALRGDVKSSIEIKVDVATLELRASPDALAKVAMTIIAPARNRASQQMNSNNMKQIGLAFHNYYDNEKHLPPLYFTDRDGKPLLSWRVAILPYIEQQAMYNAIRLDEAWDSEHNRQFSTVLIPTYCDNPPGAKTTMRLPVYPGSAWHGDGPPKVFRDLKDGTSNTIAAIDAPESAAIEWMNPQPWVLSVDDPMSDVFGGRESATVVLFDGATMVLRKSDFNNDKLKAMLTIDGGETIER